MSSESNVDLTETARSDNAGHTGLDTGDACGSSRSPADLGTRQPFLVRQSTSMRLHALDWMRGLVMILMVTDHASETFNAARPVTDSALWYDPSQSLDAVAFAYRWISHLCAPTFLFLAGTSLALSISNKKACGVSPWLIDRDLIVRGLIIAGIDLTFIHYLWLPNLLLLQVMFAIGCSMILMVITRRLHPVVVAILALGMLVANELVSLDWFYVPAETLSIARALFLSVGWIELPDAWGSTFAPDGSTNAILVAYPVLPWWSMMAFGWVLGTYLVRYRARAAQASVDPGGAGGTAQCDAPARSGSDGHRATRPVDRAGFTPTGVTLAIGILSLIVFMMLRGLNGFGNLALLRQDQSWVQWLHVSKYPPSLTFTALELSLMFLILAAMFRWSALSTRPASKWNPFLVFGQTAFFFYLAHIFILEVGAHGLGVYKQGGLLETNIACAVVLIVLYPICLWYRMVKTKYPRSVLRYF